MNNKTMPSKPNRAALVSGFALGLILAFVAASLFGSAREARAQAAAAKALRIGFADLDDIKNNSESIRKRLADVDAQLIPKGEAIEAMVAEARALYTDAVEKGTALSDAALETRKAELEALNAKINAENEAYTRLERRLALQVVEPAVDDILRAIDTVGKERGFDIILRSESVLYGVDALNITPFAIEKLDAKP